MGELLNAIKHVPSAQMGGKCRVAVVYNELAADDQEAAEEFLKKVEDDKADKRKLCFALAAYGYEIGTTSIDRHRAMRCKCRGGE